MTIVLSGGTVIDPGSGRREIADVLITGDRVTAIGKDVERSGARIIDCAGRYVTPGLVEAHSHIFQHVSTVGAPAEEAHLRRGVVAVADAGTAGASTFAAFRHFVVEPAPFRILNWLNVSVLGLLDMRFGELINPDLLVAKDAIAVARANPDIVRGLKIRLGSETVGPNCLRLLAEAVRVGEQAALPLMVHIGETGPTLPEILRLLRAGDVVSHCYTGKEHGILDEHGGLLDAVIAARARGVLFDSAHGMTNLSFQTARRAIGLGFLPDVISSDTSLRNWRGPVFDLVTTMSKFLTLGVELGDILRRTTVAPARLLGLDREGYGALRVGGPAHVTVLEILEGDVTFTDGTGAKLQGTRRIEPALSVVGGNVVMPVAWRGA